MKKVQEFKYLRYVVNKKVTDVDAVKESCLGNQTLVNPKSLVKIAQQCYTSVLISTLMYKS